MEKQVYELQIDPELEAFMSPLTESERTALEENIVANGCRTPLVVWNGVLVDGHHRYEICRKHDISFSIEEQSFADKDEAKLWMFQEQRSHRNLSPVARVVMALKCKPILMKKGKENQGHRSDLDHLFKSTKSHDTRQMIAELADVMPTMVYKVEKIQEVASEETMAALIREEIKVSPTYTKLCKPKSKAANEKEPYTDREVEELVSDIVADLADGVQELIQEYNVINCTNDMTMKILKRLRIAYEETEHQVCRHLMNLGLQRRLLFPREGEEAAEIVAAHNAMLRNIGLGDLILPELKEY